MSAVQIERPDSHPIKTKHQTSNVFFDPGTLPWTDWVMPKTWFKLLNINELTGGFTMLLKVEAPYQAPIHRHIGAIEGYMIEGEFGYGADDRGGSGSYVFEEGGAIHEPTTYQGFTMFAVAHGPVMGYNDDGSIGGIIDGEAMYAMAAANGAAGHIKRTSSLVG